MTATHFLLLDYQATRLGERSRFRRRRRGGLRAGGGPGGEKPAQKPERQTGQQAALRGAQSGRLALEEGAGRQSGCHKVIIYSQKYIG